MGGISNSCCIRFGQKLPIPDDCFLCLGCYFLGRRPVPEKVLGYSFWTPSLSPTSSLTFSFWRARLSLSLEQRKKGELALAWMQNPSRSLLLLQLTGLRRKTKRETPGKRASRQPPKPAGRFSDRYEKSTARVACLPPGTPSHHLPFL